MLSEVKRCHDTVQQKMYTYDSYCTVTVKLQRTKTRRINTIKNSLRIIHRHVVTNLREQGKSDNKYIPKILIKLNRLHQEEFRLQRR